MLGAVVTAVEVAGPVVGSWGSAAFSVLGVGAPAWWRRSRGAARGAGVALAVVAGRGAAGPVAVAGCTGVVDPAAVCGGGEAVATPSWAWPERG